MRFDCAERVVDQFINWEPASLDKHNRTHTGERPYGCDVCEQRFTEKGALVRHKASKHEEGRPHSCQICGKTFKGLMSTQHKTSYRFPPRKVSARLYYLHFCALVSKGAAPCSRAAPQRNQEVRVCRLRLQVHSNGRITNRKYVLAFEPLVSSLSVSSLWLRTSVVLLCESSSFLGHQGFFF